MFDFDNIQSHLSKWQEILRLRDWDIKLEFVDNEWRKTGDIKIDEDDKKAILLINNCNPKQTNIESVIIHELLHIKLWGMDQMIEKLLYCVYGDDKTDPKFSFAYTQFMKLLEQTTEDLTKGYKDLGAEDKSISFGRLQKDDDMIDDKTLKARQFVWEVKELARKYELPFFVVTDGASDIDNVDCEPVEYARKSHIEWELKNGIDPNHDWKDDIKS